ncbi:MAG: lactonase family protein [Candidatus Binataceae bacterium]
MDETRKLTGELRELMRVLRWAPAFITLLAMVALAGSCGNSIYPKVSSSSSPTPTVSPGNGNFVYATNNADGKVSEYSRNINTGLLKLIGTVTAGSSKGPVGLAAASGTFLYVTNEADNKVYQFAINSSSGKLGAIGGGSVAAGTSPQQVAVNPGNSSVYVTNFGTGTGAKSSLSYYTIDSASGALGAATSVTGFSAAFGAVTTTISGTPFLYVSDELSNQVFSFNINSGAPNQAGSPVPISDPAGLAVDASGTFLFAASPTTGNVYQLSTGSGTASLFNLASTGSVANLPTGVVVANPSGANTDLIYVALKGANTVALFTLNIVTNAIQLMTTQAATGLSAPTGLAADPNGQFLYVTNNGNGTVAQFSINATTGALTPLSPATVATENDSGKPNPSSAPLYITIAD